VPSIILFVLLLGLTVAFWGRTVLRVVSAKHPHGLIELLTEYCCNDHVEEDQIGGA
jgi:hypothetical protein